MVCPIVPHNIPDTHCPVTAACGDMFEVKGLVCLKTPNCVPSRGPSRPARALPVASSVEVGSKAMVATGAVCIAFHRRVMLPSRQAH